jgi:uncharacterized protein (TIGR03000 family)
MGRVLAMCLCCLSLIIPAHAGETIFPDGTPANIEGGLVIIRRGDTTMVSVGGGLLPRRGRVTTCTPEGPVITRFTMPPSSHFHVPPPLPGDVPALIAVNIPDGDGVLYINDQLLPSTGATRYLLSPPLPPGKAYPLELRAAYLVGDHVLVEEKRVQIQGGQDSIVTFDGKRAVAVRVPRSTPPTTSVAGH